MYLGMKLENENVDQMQLFVIKNNIGIMVNPDVKLKN